jgi:putative ATP-binding cassette transporter
MTQAPPAPTLRATARRFAWAVGRFLTSEVRWRARALFALVAVFALAVSGLNVLNSYVNRDFMTAIARRDSQGFLTQAVWYVAVFAASSVVAALYRLTEERLGLLWRVWQTRVLTRAYLNDRTYYRLKSAEGVENPDQRIADDVRAFTTTALSFTIMTVNGVLAVMAFSGVLWSISPLLFAVAVGYAALGTAGAVLLGRPLVGLNVRQSDAEAGFRADLVHVRENAEMIALGRREGRLLARLLRRVDELAQNFRRITGVNRNLGVFTNAYNYLIQIIPALIVAPAFIRGEVEFGVITQSSVAFGQLVGAFSLVITQFQSISAFAAVVTRLSALAGAVERTQGPRPQADDDGGVMTFDGVTLTGGNGEPLVSDLSVTIRPGSRVLVAAENEAALVALVRATAGLALPAAGRISRPPFDETLFLTQRPYLPRGTLREVLLRSGQEAVTPDAKVEQALADVGLEALPGRAGGLDAERDWGTELSLREQQLLSVARLVLARPRFAVLDRAGTALGPDGLRRTVGLFTKHGIGTVALGESPEPSDQWDAVLAIRADGTWSWHPAEPGAPS